MQEACQVLYMPAVGPDYRSAILPTASAVSNLGYEALCSRPGTLRLLDPAWRYYHDLGTAATALAELSLRVDTGLPAIDWVSFNMMLSDIRREELALQLTDLMGQYPHLPRGTLCLEILEKEPLDPDGALLEVLEAVRALRIGVALDDVGSGFFNDPDDMLWLVERLEPVLTKVKLTPTAWKSILNHPYGPWWKLYNRLMHMGVLMVAQQVKSRWVSPLHGAGIWVQSFELGPKTNHFGAPLLQSA